MRWASARAVLVVAILSAATPTAVAPTADEGGPSLTPARRTKFHPFNSYALFVPAAGAYGLRRATSRLLRAVNYQANDKGWPELLTHQGLFSV
jgi:hypothetical protein